MASYDDIFKVASVNHGLFTSAQAHELGISDKEMSRLAHDGRLTRLGYGVYQVKHHVPQPNDTYAISVKLVGVGAYLYGESVLSLHGLCPTDPRFVYVATPKRVRRSLSSNLVVVKREEVWDVTVYDAIPSQPVYAAIADCIGHIPTERLIQALGEARRKDLITADEQQELERRLS